MRPSPQNHAQVSSQPNSQPPNAHYAATPPQHAPLPVQPAPPMPPVPSAHARDPMDQIRSDIGRIDGAVNNLAREVDSMRHRMDQFMAEMRSRSVAPPPSLASSHTYDSETLDRFAETISKVSSKAHEVDGIGLTVVSLKRRVEVLENARMNSTPLKREPSHGTFPPSLHQSPAMPQPRHFSPAPLAPQAQTPAQATPTMPVSKPQPTPTVSAKATPAADPPTSGWNAVNSAKRKASTQGTDDPKRTRLRTDLGTNGFTPVAAAAAQTPPASYGQPPRVVSAQEAYSHDQWQAKQYAPPSSERSASARIPEKPPPEFGTPIGDKWPSADAENGMPGSPAQDSPTGGERNGHTAAQQAMRRTRQKPIRNAEGILIRKDGKPDQRSVSSAMNLKKVHARKMAEGFGSRAGSPGSIAESPTAATGGMFALDARHVDPC